MGYYDDMCEGYDELYGEEQRKKYAFLKDWLESLEGLTLDVGSGTGIINEFFKPAVLSDSSFKMIKRASGTRVVCDARYLPFKDKSFDNITCFTVLQDILEKEKVIKELKRVCRGRIILTLLKRLKTKEEIESLFDGFDIVDYREEEKDHCFFLEVRKEKKAKEVEKGLEITKF